MANDAFALSPISASAAQPSDGDYQAICDAFMETSRGRWFLTEYTRRNRNADTAMVLEAVSRIEASIATQKQVAAAATLADTAEAVRALVAAAAASATEALDRHVGTAPDTAPAGRGLRIIREVAWRLREVGYDSRICDIIETQTNTIEANFAAPDTAQLTADLRAVFDALARGIDDLVDDGEPPAAPAASAAPESASAAATVEMPASAAEPVAQHAPETHAPELPRAAAEAELVAEMAFAEAVAQTAMPDDTPAPGEVAESIAPVHDDVAEAFAEPDITLDLVDVDFDSTIDTAAPAEMAPPVEGERDEYPQSLDLGGGADASSAIVFDEPVVAAEPAPAAVAEAPVFTPPPGAPAPSIHARMMAEAPRPASPLPPNRLSLGESLLARGMVQTTTAKVDPLAPIRRMSQAEKIAFFS